MSVEATPSYTELEPGHRRRLLLRATLRATVVPILLLVLYYALPLDRPGGAASAGWFVLGFVLFAAAVAWQVYAITRSAHPRLRQIEALTVLVPVFLLMFSGTYYLLNSGQPQSFTQPLSRTDALYFTVTVFATVGFGDITARTETARVLVTFQMLGGLILVGLVAKLLIGAVQVAMQRKAPGGSARKDR
jgi:hypothetical protein